MSYFKSWGVLLLKLDEFRASSKDFSLDCGRAGTGPDEDRNPGFGCIMQSSCHGEGSSFHVQKHSLAFSGDLGIAMSDCEGHHLVGTSHNTWEIFSLCHRRMRENFH